ncbi:MAG: hypothetical protein K2I73_00145, partial [Eubacterium sp.]|nr:hypothetical protein [Eubacterium sp.]
SHYEDIDIQIRNEYLQSMVSNCSAAKDIMYVLGDSIDVIFDNYSDLCTVAVDAWKEGITKHNGLMKYFDNQVANKSIIMDYTKKIQKYDSAYIVSELSASNTSTETASGGCYIATAVYGSYDCPEVWTLRRYRDNQLSKTWYGRLFIHIYYAISPTIVKWFGGTEWFKKMWKGKLDNMVKNLQSEGVESTPYEDRNW